MNWKIVALAAVLGLIIGALLMRGCQRCPAPPDHSYEIDSLSGIIIDLRMDSARVHQESLVLQAERDTLLKQANVPVHKQVEDVQRRSRDLGPFDVMDYLLSDPTPLVTEQE